ncbi:MAG: hypothetical protein ABI543_00270 [Ignavibacteria bacterium]
MVESTLILLLKKFDKQQLKEFNNFVKSPFFNTNNALVKLYEYIRKQHPEFIPEKLEKKYVYKKLYGKTEFNDGFLRVLMSNLQSLAEEYLMHKAFQHEPLIKKKYLLDELSSMGARKHAEKVLNEGLKELAKSTPKNPEDYLGMYYMAFYKRYLYSTQFIVSKNNKPDESLYEDQKYFNIHFLLRTLASHFYLLNQKQIINYEPRLIFLDEITLFLERNPEYLEIPMLNITFLRVLLLKNNDIKDYYRLKNAFFGTFEKLDNKDAFNTISIIINYCQKNYSDTEDEIFLKEKFDILKFAVENNLNTFEKAEGFEGSRFNNIVNTALEFNETGWTEDFIRHYGKELEPDRRDYLIAFASALVLSAKKENDEALIRLSKLKNPSSSTDKFNLKTLQLKIYYEKNYIDQAESTADSFRHMIQNDNVLPEAYRESYKNFYSVYVKLLALKLRNDKSDVSDFREKLNTTKNIINKKWLNEKVKEIENK